MFVDILPAIWHCSNQPYIHFHCVGYSTPSMDKIITRELHKGEERYVKIFDKMILKENRKKLINQMNGK